MAAASHQINLGGVDFRIRSEESAQLVRDSVAQTEAYIANIQELMGAAADRQHVLLLALLNRTMELNKMRDELNLGQARDRRMTDWALQLTGQLQQELARG